MMFMKTLKYMVLAVAVVAATATGAYADAVFFQSGGDLPESDADALDFVKIATGDNDLTLLFKTPGGSGDGTSGTCPGGPDCIISDASGEPGVATVSWAGMTTSVDWILIVNGAEGVGHECTGTTGGTGGKCYALYSVTGDQLFNSNGDQIIELPAGSGGTSHVSFFTSGSTPPETPEPGVLLLLGTGLIGTVALARRLV